MNSFLQIFIALAAITIIFGIIWSLFGSLQTPIQCGKGTGIATVIAVHGNAEGLEQTLKGLIWLRESGVMLGQIILVDAGLNHEGLILSRLILKKYTGVVVCKAEDVAQWIIPTSKTLTISK